MVSVIVPTRNSARTLEACLASIRAQNADAIELIVIDNHSDDATESIARRYSDVVVNRGPERSAQRNYGARLANGEYLLFIDSDMVLSPGVVSECLATVNRSEAPAVVIPEVSIGLGFWAACRTLERSCYVGDDLYEAARFFRRNEFEKVGGFDEELTGGEDWDLSQRIRRARSLPRTVSAILHDEGRLRLRDDLAKKRYYAGSIASYLRKHPSHGLRQANAILRTAFFRNWKRLARHPVRTAGIVTMKLCELAVALPIIALAGLRDRPVSVTRP